MHIFCALLILCFLTHPLIAQDKSAETALGTSIVGAIASNDVVAYSQCWVSTRQITADLKAFGVKQSAEEIKQMNEYFALRNKDIAESFRKMQALIDQRKIDRQSIRLKSCEAMHIGEDKLPKGTVKVARGFNVTFAAGDEEWRFRIDDAAVNDGMWYFSDSPTNLYAGDTVLSFRDHREQSD